MKVGNSPIGCDCGFFEQECNCGKFPCNCYIQTKKGNWVKKNENR
jgi:hypothetical protein